MRIGKRDVIAQFNRLIAAWKREMKGKGSFSFDYSLDYNATYGGWLVVEIGPDGSESNPWVRKRLSTKDMYWALAMSADMMEDFKRWR